MDKYQFEEMVSNTEFLVEADSFASSSLWARWAKESRSPREDYITPLDWKSHNVGSTLQIGTLDNRPLMLTLFWSTIEGVLVCFYNSGSQLVDHKRVEEFLNEKFPGIVQRDAQNFTNVVCDIQERSSKKAVDLPESKRILGREAVELFRKDGILTTRTFETALLAKDNGEEGAQEILDAVEALNIQCSGFRDVVWPWLKKYYNDSDSRGHEANAGPLNMMVWGTAGRVMVSLKFQNPTDDQENDFISLLGSDGQGDGMYIRGAHGNAAVLSNMIQIALQYNDALKENIKPNKDVSIAV